MIGRRHSKKRAAHRGFSLIELMMVISILSLISSIIMASMVTAREKAREAKAKVEVRQIVEAALVATGESGTTLYGTIGLADEYCPDGIAVEPETSGPCYHDWKYAAKGIGQASDGLYVDGDVFFVTFMYDPWKVSYILRIKQGINGNPDTCGDPDEVRSAGPDRTPGTDDDVVMLVPLSPSCP